jgi:transketolase
MNGRRKKMEQQKIKELQEKATAIRRHIIREVAEANSGHVGGALSIADIVSYLYFKEMNVDPSNPKWQDRDRLVLSKGHACAAIYAALAEKGYFPVEELLTFRQTGTRLQGHPDMNKTPGVDMSSGSLGQGLSAANGMAMAAKLDKKDYKIFVILGDGELQEGQVWEAAMTAAHYKLDNVIAFLDYNGLQIDGPVAEVMSPNPVEDKFKAFGWNVVSIDGHDFNQIEDAVQKAKSSKGKPTMIIANTIKGKGVSFMENQVGWHGVAPNKEQRDAALKELGV